MIGALVAAVLQELIKKIAIGAVNFDAVETRRLGVPGALAERLDNASDLLSLERPGDHIRPLGTQQAHAALRGDRAWRDRKRPIVIAWIGDPAHVPKLHQNAAAGGVDGFGYATPAVHLFLRPDARRVRIADPRRGH